jgi:hypothetical protein
MASYHQSLRLVSFLISMNAITLFADEAVAIKDLPPAVTSTITRRYPKGELSEARKTLDEKTEIYEVDLTVAGKIIEIAVLADGTIDWVAVDFAPKELPKPVAASIRKKYPAAKFNHASAVYTVKNGKDHLEHYHVEITSKGGKKRDLEVSPKGEIEEDEPSAA